MIQKFDKTEPWGTHNFNRPAAQMKEAVIDMFLLAQTQIRVYHSTSSFCNVARVISGEGA
jgi:hypothetical protein